MKSHWLKPRIIFPLLIVLIFCIFVLNIIQLKTLFLPPYRQKKITIPPEHIILVLPAGGARQLSWVPTILAELDEAGITPEMIIGSSGGAIVGTAKAQGADPEVIQSSWENTAREYYGSKAPVLAKLPLFGYLYRLRKLNKIYPDLLQNSQNSINFNLLINKDVQLIINSSQRSNQAPYLFATPNVNISLLEKHKFSTIDSQRTLKTALMATSSIPIFLPEVEHDNIPLRDGAFSHPSELEIALAIAEQLLEESLIIYVDANHPARVISPPTYRQTILLNQIQKLPSPPDILVIRPERKLPGGDYMEEITEIKKEARNSAKKALTYLDW